MSRKKMSARDEESRPAPAGAKSKKTKELVVDDGSIRTELSEGSQFQEDNAVITDKKKKKRKNGSLKAFELRDDDGEEAEMEDEYDVGEAVFSCKKGKSKTDGGNSVFGALSFELLEDEDDDGRDNEVQWDEEGADPVVSFSGKKKRSKSSKKSGNSLFRVSSAFDAIEDGGGDNNDGEVVDNSVNESEGVAGTSQNKKKKKKKKKGGRTTQEDDLDKILAELGEGPPVSKPYAAPIQEEKVQVQPETVGVVDDPVEKEDEEDSVESAAAKKKKKKKEREKEKKAAAAAARASFVDIKFENHHKLRTEATEPKKNESKGKVADNKVPKHVRDKQEELAKRKEVEEKAKREEEERLRREEEERQRQDELVKQAEEAKRQKKEKLRIKKEEGRLPSAKQKKVHRRLEAIRNQILANAEFPLPTTDTSAPAKRPLYQKKKTKPTLHQANGTGSSKPGEGTKEKETQEETMTEVISVESEKAIETESIDVEEKSKVFKSIKEKEIEEDKDEDEWDAKSWDDAVVSLSVRSVFADEEVDFETELVAEKGVKKAISASQNGAPPAAASTKPAVATKKPVSSRPTKSQGLDDNKKKSYDFEDIDKNKAKSATGNKAAQNSDATPKSEENLRSPICCIMGHVDAGKTKLLDCIRETNVQEGEAGGITQQIGATYFPAENILERTKELKADAKLKVPGLLVIDTPGHESFTNLRSRGSGLCDIAILVVDIMDGLKPQTIESLNLLKMRNTKFIVALNKVDRIYDWKSNPNAPIRNAIKQQSKNAQSHFNMRLTNVITQFKEQGLNTELYYENRDMGETCSIVPTSAITGEGIPDLLLLLVKWTEKTMVEKLTYSNEVQCTVLEVKVVEGHGTTIDVVLVNGVLHEGDQIVVCGMQGPIITTIRALLTPHPMKELRVKGNYLHHKEIKAAQSIKITAQGLEHAIVGTGLYVVGHHNDLEDTKESAMEDMKSDLINIGCIKVIDIGRIASIEDNKKPVDLAKKGQKVSIKIVGSNPEERQKMFGRHFQIDDELVSHISRKSTDVLKANYGDDLSPEESKLVRHLEKLFGI
ncbi:Translation initiation factor 2, gamma subunit [Trema orientale]|uniref:Translation initiation factor 2, gamma subunit n=1 Tax=Trema orientale TaxID=63057 RepID=A0A2P5CHK2_TREOI|nr:Translation initiation factor 2, gamma subunit [Trema orientale]